MTITLRNTKGSALTHTELDGNFSDLDSRVTTLEGASDSDSQTLTLVGTDLTISGGNTVSLASLQGASDTNTYVASGTVAGNTLTLTMNDASTVTVDVSSLLDNTDTDAQTLTLTGNTLSISNGNSVDLSSFVDNEADTLATVTSRGATTNTNIDLGGQLSVTGDVSANANLTVDLDLTVRGNTSLDGNATVDGSLILEGDTAADKLEIKKGTLGVSNAWVIGIDEANTEASSLVTFNVDGSSIWSTTSSALTINPTTTFNGAVNVLGGNNLTVGTVGGEIMQVDGANIIFGGATSDVNTTTLTVTDPTAVRTITLPDASGTVALLSDISGGSGIALTDLSVGAEDPASGDGGISYDNTTGVFTYAPPDLSLYQPVGNLNADIDSHLNTSTATANQILSWDGADYAWVADQTSGGGTDTVIAPFAFANVETTANGSGTGISWSNWNSGNGSLDFTFDNAQANTQYTVVTDSETFDDYSVGINSKTTTGFTAEFYDSSGTRVPSNFSPFTIIVYAETPTATITGSNISNASIGALSDVSISSATTGQVLKYNGSSWVNDTDAGGIALTDLSVTVASAGTANLSYDNSTGVFTYTPPDLGNAIVSQAQYTSTVTTNAADTSDTGAYIIGNTGSASATGSSTGWVFADIVQDPDNPGTTTILDVDAAIFTGSVVGDITTGTGTQTIQGTVDFTSATSVDFTGVTVSGLTNGIALTDLSVTTAANGLAGLSYDNTSGVFTFTPPDLSGYLEAGGTVNVSSIEPTATTSGDGNDLTITGGDATDLNSQGGDTIITGGSGALTSGSVDIGTTQTDAVTIGAAGINTTIGGNFIVNNNATFESGTFEAFDTITGATGVVTHDCNNGHIFYHTSPSADWTANFTNLGLNATYATGVTIVIDQGATARIPTAVQTDGTARTIVWQGGSAPTGTNNGVDVVSFSILRTSGSYIVLGQLVDFA